MSDRELLELAAKAAGISYVEYAETFGGHPALRRKAREVQPWQPLHDDGDALRLAVKLELSVMTANTGAPTAYSRAETWDDRGWTEMHRAHGGDANAATRRAIVRAATAIGASMAGAAEGGGNA